MFFIISLKLIICLYEANCNLDGAMVVETKNFYDFGFALHPLCCFGDQIPVSFEWWNFLFLFQAGGSIQQI